MTVTWYPVITFPLETNLLPLLRLLHDRGINPRVTEEKGRQQLWVAEQSQTLAAATLSSQWSTGELAVSASEPAVSSQETRLLTHCLELPRLFPVNIAIILLGILGTLLVYLDMRTLTYAQWLLFQIVSDGAFLPWSAVLDGNQYWRLLTPIFIHFGPLHILFNGIVLWQMGNRIEQAKGSMHYLLLIVITGVIANMAQYLTQANTVFGGLSGVVYGVIGYIAVYQTLVTHPLLQFNRAIIAFFIGWLLLGFTGIVAFFIGGSVANSAHLAGLIAGGLWGGAIALSDRKHYNPP